MKNSIAQKHCLDMTSMRDREHDKKDKLQSALQCRCVVITITT